MYYLNVFLFFSILGHIMENAFFFIIKTHKDSGFMFLWWTPFYGMGVVISTLVYKIISKKVENKLWRNIILFLTLFVLLTLLEFVGGFLIEKIYGYAMWDYGDIPLHIGKYVSVPTSLGWVAFSFLYLYVIKRFTDRIIIRIPKILSVFLAIVFLFDFVCSIFKIFY